MRIVFLFLLAPLAFFNCSKKLQQTTQHPSPMEEHIQPHIRVDQVQCEGEQIEISDIFENPAFLFISNNINEKDTVDLVFTFMEALR